VPVASYDIRRCGQHDGGDRKHDSWPCVFPLGQNVVNETSVQPPIAILKRMNLDKTKRRCGCLQDASTLYAPMSLTTAASLGTGRRNGRLLGNNFDLNGTL
jgi:hypothetical protein